MLCVAANQLCYLDLSVIFDFCSSFQQFTVGLSSLFFMHFIIDCLVSLVVNIEAYFRVIIFKYMT